MRFIENNVKILNQFTFGVKILTQKKNKQKYSIEGQCCQLYSREKDSRERDR